MWKNSKQWAISSKSSIFDYYDNEMKGSTHGAHSRDQFFL